MQMCCSAKDVFQVGTVYLKQVSVISSRGENMMTAALPSHLSPCQHNLHFYPYLLVWRYLFPVQSGGISGGKHSSWQNDKSMRIRQFFVHARG